MVGSLFSVTVHKFTGQITHPCHYKQSQITYLYRKCIRLDYIFFHYEGLYKIPLAASLSTIIYPKWCNFLALHPTSVVSPFGLHYAHLTPTNTGHVILFTRVVSLDVFQIHLSLNIFFLSFWCCRSSHIVSSKVKIQTPGSFLSQMMNQGRASPSGVTSQLHSRSHVNAAEERQVMLKGWL